jgi:hypothetical protein
MPQLSDDDFGFVVFEALVPDAWSCLHESSLDSFVLAGRITESMKTELLKIRSSFFALVDAAQATGALPLPEIRRDAKWLDIARRSERILSECVYEGSASYEGSSGKS